jgi:predicted PurR-regulated permease PerM
MEKSNLFTHIYGYLVCLVTVITFLICITSLVNAVIDKTDPLSSTFGSYNSPDLTSFDTYKLDLMKTIQQKDSNQKNVLPDDQTLRKVYEAAKQSKIDKVVFNCNKNIIISGLLILICLILFLIHWRLARKSILQTNL